MDVQGYIKKTVVIMLLLSAFSLSVPAMSQAASLPEVQQLAGIAMDRTALWSAGKLAIGKDGTLYVVDALNGHILKFDRSGRYLGDIPFKGIATLAVDTDGTLYIGSNREYSVSIFRNNRVVGHFGVGKNEFRSIRDIAVDPSTGRIYVADNVGNAVRIFNRSGKDLGSIVEVNIPVSVEVTEAHIYVVDIPVVQENASRTTASRITVFDKDYALLNTITDLPEEKLLYRPTDLLVAGNIIYVSDAALRSILLFDTAGNFLGEIQDEGGEIDTAVSMAMSSDGILYVSSNNTHRIYMFSITEKSAANANSGSVVR